MLVFRCGLVVPGMFCVLLLFVRQNAQADTETPRVVLGPDVQDLIVGPGMNATGKNLRGSEFVGQNLTGAIFDACNLDGVRIHDCNLTNASFKATVLEGAFIDECQMDGADFTDAIINGVGWSNGRFLEFIDLSPKQLTSTKSYKTKNLKKCPIGSSKTEIILNFQGADLEDATFIHGDFTKSNFRDARIQNAKFVNCKITFEQLTLTADFKRHRLRAELPPSTFIDGITGKCDFSGIDLRGSKLAGQYFGQDVIFTDALINQCELTGGVNKSQIISTKSYQDGNLTDLYLKSVDLSHCDFSGMNLTGSTFYKCNLDKANFTNTVITDVNFVPFRSQASQGLTVEQIKSTWNYKHNHMQGIVFPEGMADALREKPAPRAGAADSKRNVDGDTNLGQAKEDSHSEMEERKIRRN